MGRACQLLQKAHLENMRRVGVAIITHNAKSHLAKCLPPYLLSPLKPRVVVVNSSSNDGTVEEAENLGAETLVVPRNTFNHGSTRELARNHLECDIVVMATPDAYASSEDALEKLIAPLVKGDAAMTYGRQLPRQGAPFLEAFGRSYHYPQRSEVRTQKDFKQLGNRTFFCSNAFAAYSNEALNRIGGFERVLIGEDAIAALKLLQEGFSLAYVAEACVYHSHNYSLLEEFRRYFDTGLYRHRLPGSDTSSGKAFTKALLKATAKSHPHLLPYALAQTAAKWCGYRLGQVSKNGPNSLKRLLSSQDYYW